MSEIRYLDDHRYPGPPTYPLPNHITGTPSQAELDAEARMFTWLELKEIIRSGRLERLMRNKGQQRRYDVWMRGMKEGYGTTERYLKQARLPWKYTEPTGPEPLPPPPPPQADPPTPIGRGAASPSAADSGVATPASAGFASLDDVKLHHKLLSSGATTNGAMKQEAEYLRYDPQAGFDEERYAVLANDWPYCVPYGVRHYCVWSKVPIAHPSLVAYDPDKWAIIQDEGLGGFTGVIPVLSLHPSPPAPHPLPLASSSSPCASSLSTSAAANEYTSTTCTRTQPPTASAAHTVHPHVPASSTALETPANEAYAIDILHSGPEERRWAGVGYESEGGEEVGRMVRALWDERGWECMWFVNPPRLQSVPGLSHFHVFARRKTPGEISATGDAVRDGALLLVR